MAKKKESTQPETPEKNLAAVLLGKLGGKKTAERGPEYFKNLQAKRKKRGGGRPRKNQMLGGTA